MNELKTAQAWRKSRIAARILRRADAGRLSERDRRIGRQLGHDPAVTPRLLQQAFHGIDSFLTRQLADSSRPVA